MKRLIIKIVGQVQGVNFRSFIKSKADQLDLTGFVKNESDGSVTVEAQGEENNLKELLRACQTGPKLAKIEKTITDWQNQNNQLTDFEISY